MDREIWKLVFAAVKRASKVVEREERELRLRRDFYPHWLIVAMYLWCVWADRPLNWACDRSHYSSLFRPRKLPSVSRFARRVRCDATDRVLRLVHDELSQRGLVTGGGYLDGKPLLVSPVSKDRQAARGKVSGGFAKGYKLHAFVNRDRRIVVWSVTPLNVAEQSVAVELLPHLPPMTPDALVHADGNYDSAPLHKAAAALAQVRPEKAFRLITPLKGRRRVGPDGHHPVTLRQMGPDRRELVSCWEKHPDLLRYVMRERDEIERGFGVLCCAAGGLGTALPAWVRTLGRVRRWVGAKIILYNARLETRGRGKAAAPGTAESKAA